MDRMNCGLEIDDDAELMTGGGGGAAAAGAYGVLGTWER